MDLLNDGTTTQIMREVRAELGANCASSEENKKHEIFFSGRTFFHLIMTCFGEKLD